MEKAHNTSECSDILTFCSAVRLKLQCDAGNFGRTAFSRGQHEIQ